MSLFKVLFRAFHNVWDIKTNGPKVNCKNTYKNFFLIIPALGKYWKTFLLTFFLLVFVVCLSYPQPILIKQLFNTAIKCHDFNYAVKIFTILAVIYITSFICNQFYYAIKAICSRRITACLQENIITRTLNLPVDVSYNYNSGYLNSRVSYEVDSINNLFTEIIPHCIIQIFRFAGGLFFLFYLNWALALGITLTIPFPFVISFYFARKEYVLVSRQLEENATLSAAIVESLFNLPLIKVCTAEDRILNRIKSKILRITELADAYALLDMFSGAASNIIPGLVRFAVLITGTFLIINGKWDIGSLLAFVLYLGFVYGAIGEFTASIADVQRTRAAIDRYAGILNVEQEDPNNNGKYVSRLNGHISFKNVTFGYEEQNTLFKNVYFDIHKGENVKILGKNGAGKTTLIYLLLRFYKQQEGRLYVDGDDIFSLNLKSYRKRIGFIAQNTAVFTGSLKENLLFGVDVEDCEYIDFLNNFIKDTDFALFIDSFPGGYNYEIKENGKNLSEGEKKKIAILRTFIADPDIVVLDEFDANLDRKAADEIWRIVTNLFIHKTVLYITHNLMELNDDDEIIYIKDDKTVIKGKHDYLQSSSKDYCRFISVQGQ